MQGQYYHSVAFYLTSNFCSIQATMSLTSLMAPLPMSPHIIFLLTGPSISYPQLLSTLSWAYVIGWSHIIVFIDGHTIIGFFINNFDEFAYYFFWKGQARQTSVSRLSQSPFDILAKVLALNGAISMQSAHFLSQICKTGSPRFLHISHSIQSQYIKLRYLLTKFSQLSINFLPFMTGIYYMLRDNDPNIEIGDQLIQEHTQFNCCH